MASYPSAPLPRCDSCHIVPATTGYSACFLCHHKPAIAATAMERTALAASQGVNLLLVSPIAEKRKRAAGEDTRADAIERLRKRMRMEVPKTQLQSFEQTPKSTSDRFQKYVAAVQLCNDLKQRFTDKIDSVSFHGTYAIIAAPEIDNERRARRVARDLKNCAPFYFITEDGTVQHRSDARNTYTILHKCTCLLQPSPAAKSSKGNLLAYFTSKKNKPDSSASECGGRIIISVEDDTSHPLGWLGQRIKVSVTHPKAGV